MGNIIKVRKKQSFEDIIDYNFNNQSLLKNALTHPSINKKKLSEYQRLEFLGDSVLNFIVTMNLISANPIIDEGQMTKKRANIINKKSLSKCAKEIGLKKYLLIGGSINKITDKMFCDTYEALIGAITLDSNIEKAESFIKSTLLSNIKKYETKTNYKGRLIEFCRTNNFSLPEYNTKKKGLLFISKIKKIKIKAICQGKGNTKKEAENQVSKKALAILKN